MTDKMDVIIGNPDFGLVVSMPEPSVHMGMQIVRSPPHPHTVRKKKKKKYHQRKIYIKYLRTTQSSYLDVLRSGERDGVGG